MILYLLYALFLLVLARYMFKAYMKWAKTSDIEDIVENRKENSSVYEKFKGEMTRNAKDDADFCAEKIKDLSNSEN